MGKTYKCTTITVSFTVIFVKKHLFSNVYISYTDGLTSNKQFWRVFEVRNCHKQQFSLEKT